MSNRRTIIEEPSDYPCNSERWKDEQGGGYGG
jgi:hypothetical protein